MESGVSGTSSQCLQEREGPSLQKEKNCKKIKDRAEMRYIKTYGNIESKQLSLLDSEKLTTTLGNKLMPYTYQLVVSTLSFVQFILLKIKRKRQFSKLKNLARQRGINHEDSRVSYNTHKGNI